MGKTLNRYSAFYCILLLISLFFIMSCGGGGTASDPYSNGDKDFEESETIVDGDQDEDSGDLDSEQDLIDGDDVDGDDADGDDVDGDDADGDDVDGDDADGDNADGDDADGDDVDGDEDEDADGPVELYWGGLTPVGGHGVSDNYRMIYRLGSGLDSGRAMSPNYSLDNGMIVYISR